ncbi:MAG: FAD-binding protein [Chloroflexi bacterium]|nr:FAD-binding protein [Chloroflexota bacterium]
MYEHDVLIIGAGLAGLRAAVEAEKLGLNTAVLSKVHPVRSHSCAAQGGINAALTDRGDVWEDHAYDTVKGSDFLGDQDAIEVMAREAGDDLIELEHMGVIFSREKSGRLEARAFGGQRVPRTFFVGAITGSAMLHVLYEQAIKHDVRVYEEWFVTSLIIEEGVCHGAIAFNMHTGEMETIRAKSVIMAAGGAGRVFEPSTNALICTGDGLALAWNAGVSMMDMEMVQYHPTTLAGNGILLSEAARGEGAHLLNSEGDRFMERYAPEFMELASRDVVSRAEQTEINEGRSINGNVLLDLRHLGKTFIEERLGYLQEVAVEFRGIDLSEHPIEIRPGVHYIMGGIKTNVDGATVVPGLYAAGECANVSVHGGNRLGANSLLDTIVFGRRSATAAAEYIKSVDSAGRSEEHLDAEKARIQALLDRPKGIRWAAIRNELATSMTEGIGVYRDQASMEGADAKVDEMRAKYSQVSVENKGKVFNTDLIFTLELDYMIDVAKTITQGALMRKESRGAHSRTDMPDRDDKNWLKHTHVFKDGDGVRTETSDVTITQWQPVERVY